MTNVRPRAHKEGYGSQLRSEHLKQAGQNGSGDFVPPWMADLGLEAGPNGWLNASKAQLRTMQRPDKPLTVRVWATGILHAPGYNGQEALIVRSKNGPKEPLRPNDFVWELFQQAKKYYTAAGVKASETEWALLKEPKEEIRAAISELEEYGVAQRTDGKGTPLSELSSEQRQRLPSGRTRIFFWIFPRNANADRVRQEWDRFQKRHHPITSSNDAEKVEVGKVSLPVPPIWQILKVFQIEKPEKAQINAPDYQKRVERARVAARAVFLEVVLQPLPIGDAEVGLQSTLQVVLTAGALESKPERKVLRAQPPSSSRKKADDDAVSQPSPATEDWDAVGRAAGQYFHVDDAWIQKLVARCKQHAPDITPAEIAQLVHAKGPLAMKKDSPGGFLLAAVPNLCEGESFRRLRERINAANEHKVPTCACGQPINIEGQCWECYEREHSQAAGGNA